MIEGWIERGIQVNRANSAKAVAEYVSILLSDPFYMGDTKIFDLLTDEEQVLLDQELEMMPAVHAPNLGSLTRSKWCSDEVDEMLEQLAIERKI